jgi:hypothetical protein
MKPDDIIRMAEEAGFPICVGFFGEMMVTFANLVAAHERERPWVGLTDEEIKSLPSWWPSYEDAPALIQLVKDVEAKLKEKNCG